MDQHLTNLVGVIGVFDFLNHGFREKISFNDMLKSPLAIPPEMDSFLQNAKAEVQKRLAGTKPKTQK